MSLQEGKFKHRLREGRLPCEDKDAPCEDGGKDWNDVSINQGIPRIVGNY